MLFVLSPAKTLDLSPAPAELPTTRGRMIAAFTTADAVARYLATAADELRGTVKLAMVEGAVLFGEVAPLLGDGVIINIAGPRTFGFDLPACREIAMQELR